MVQPSPTSQSRPAAPRHQLAAALLAVAAVGAGIGLLAGAGCEEAKPATHANPIGLLPPNGAFSSGWQFQPVLTPGDHVTRLELRDPTLYVYLASKRVLALDRNAGTLKFSMDVFSPTDRLQSVVEVPDYLVFANATEIEVYTRAGEFVRHIPLDSPIQSNAAAESDPRSVAAAGDVIYFGAAGRDGLGLVKKYNLGRPDAPEDWEYMTRDQGRVDAAPAIFNGYVFSGSSLGEVDAVNTARTLVWDTDLGRFYAAGGIVGDMQVDTTGLYFASRDTKVSCVSRLTGKLVWQYFTGTALTSSPVVTSDTVYQQVPGTGLVAVDKLKGAYIRASLWARTDAEQFLAQDDRNAYLSVAVPPPAEPPEGYQPSFKIVAVDKRTGKTAFESDRSDYVSFGTNTKDGVVYAVRADGKLLAVQPVLKPGQIGELVLAPRQPDRPAVVAFR